MGNRIYRLTHHSHRKALPERKTRLEELDRSLKKDYEVSYKINRYQSLSRSELEYY